LWLAALLFTPAAVNSRALIERPYQLSRNTASQLQLLLAATPVITTDPRSICICIKEAASMDQGSGWTYDAHQNNPALTLLAFVGASPQNIYSFE